MPLMTCDFCLVKRRELWGFSVAGFVEPVYGIVNVEGEWGICQDCAESLEKRDLPALLRRVEEADIDIKRWEAMVSRLILNITGPMVKFDHPDTPLYGEETNVNAL